MSFIMISGIFISRVVFPNINVGNEQWFKVSHISVSFLVLILVAAHIGLHWQWVINVCKNMTKFKKSKKSLSIAAKLTTAALLVIGIYEINETGFLGKLGGVARVLNVSSSDMPQKAVGSRILIAIHLARTNLLRRHLLVTNVQTLITMAEVRKEE